MLLIKNTKASERLNGNISTTESDAICTNYTHFKEESRCLENGSNLIEKAKRLNEKKQYNKF